MFGKSFLDLIARVEELERRVLALSTPAQPAAPAPEDDAWAKDKDKVKGKAKAKDDY